MAAIKEHCDTGKDINGSIKIILTADEEGDAINGIRNSLMKKFSKKVI